MSFTWKDLNDELSEKCPALMTILSSVVSDGPPEINSKPFHHMMMSAAVVLHARNQEMSVVQYIVGFILTHGGCTLRDIERLSCIGLSVNPRTIHNRLSTWHECLDSKILSIRDSWASGGNQKYQLVGDNWDKNILPSFRTSQQKTKSIHLFNVIAVVDRVPTQNLYSFTIPNTDELDFSKYVPSVMEQDKLLHVLTFLFATSVLSNLPKLAVHFKGIYPKHLEHKYSQWCGMKTEQFPLGLFPCNENKNQELIRLLKNLTERYVPQKNGCITEEVFFGGDRLTDERVQGAQNAMLNAETPQGILQGFISKIEDFHRLMNFLEAIGKLTFSTDSIQERGTMYYYRNLLNLRNVKGKIKNAYRAYKLLYYTILDAICLLLFTSTLPFDIDSEVPFAEDFVEFTNDSKIEWLNTVCSKILKKYFFDDSVDIFEQLREVLVNPNHNENYWVGNLKDGRVHCHFCDKSYAYIGSLKSHESKLHGVSLEKSRKKIPALSRDELQDHIIMIFKLVLLHKNLDSAVDMGDGERSVRSAKYELAIYNKTNKVKYMIGSIHLTALTSGLLPTCKAESLIANRFINLQGGVNNNIALDEFVEMLNRDSKIASSGHQTVDSITGHSKEYPHIIDMTKHFDDINNMHQKKGFHHLPSYVEDVRKVFLDLKDLNVLDESRDAL